MITRKGGPFLVIWLFLILVTGFGAFIGSGLFGPNKNVPPAGTTFAETTEALAKVQWQKLLRLRGATT